MASGSVSGISFNETGHIIDARVLIGDDLPVATDSTVGGVMVPGPVLDVDADGNITHADSGVTPGVFPKVTVNAQGHVIEGAALAEDDVPPLSADKITSGELPTARLADRSVTQQKLDYSISFIQDMPTPTLAVRHFTMVACGSKNQPANSTCGTATAGCRLPVVPWLSRTCVGVAVLMLQQVSFNT